MTKAAVSQADLQAAHRIINMQQALVDHLEPGSRSHRIAVELLLIYRDSLFLLEELAELTRDPARSTPSNCW